MSELNPRSWIWYLLPALFGLIGGAITYYLLRKINPKMAKNCLNIGIVITAFNILFAFVSIFLITDLIGEYYGLSFDANQIALELESDLLYNYNLFSVSLNTDIESINCVSINRCIEIHNDVIVPLSV